MKQSKQQLQQFAALISEILKLTRLMSKLLSKESTTLKENRPETLNELIEHKKQVAQSLNVKTHQLDHFLISSGFKGGKEGITAWLQTVPSSNPIHSTWSKMKVATEACAKQNEINGATIRVMQQHARRSLDILRGRHQSDSFYGADGYSKKENRSNSILTV
jgi:flagella synthesis protein FlgN